MARHNGDVPTFPGPASVRLLEEMGRYVVSEPYPFVLDLERCSGMRLATVDGDEIIDWAGYYGSKLLGHNHPGLKDPDFQRRLALAATNKVANPDFLTRECVDYYRMLHRLRPACMGEKVEVYAVNSGAEAVENMMKYLVSRFNSRCLAQGRIPGARRFIYFDHAFHGRTVFALAVTQTVDPVATRDFHGLTAGGNLKMPFPAVDNDSPQSQRVRRTEQSLALIEAALQQMAEEIVGIIVEPIQGAGGQRVATPEFFRGLSELAHRYGVALAFDEVQTGLGATGKMWAIDHFDLPHPPTAVATGKKFGCGVVFMHEPLEEVGVLDSTWGGTLVDMVRVVREVEIVERERLVAQADETGRYLAEGLRRLQAAHPRLVFNVRGMGLYQGFSLPTVQMKRELIRVALHEFGLLLLGAGDRSIRTRPNLSVTRADVDQFLEVLGAALGRLAG